MSPADQHLTQIHGTQRVNNVETELEKLRLDVLSTKQNDQMRQEEMEAFFKKASLEYFHKLKEVQQQLDAMK